VSQTLTITERNQQTTSLLNTMEICRLSTIGVQCRLILNNLLCYELGYMGNTSHSRALQASDFQCYRRTKALCFSDVWKTAPEVVGM